jgi:hypothetical protein
MGKGSTPRPFSVSQAEFGNNMDLIFGKKEPKPRWVPPLLPGEDPIATGLVAKYKCWCYNCLNKITDERGWPVTASTFIVCPTCGNKRCPKSTDHNLACTNSNEPGQPGSRY